METLWHDVRRSLRGVTRNPGFGLLVVFVLALGIGANTAVFSVVNGLMLRPLPGAADADELVSVSVLEPGTNLPRKLSHANCEDYRSLDNVFEDAVCFSEDVVLLSADGGNPERIQPLVVTGNYFDALGVKARYGRTFATDEGTRMGAGNVVVLSHEFWQRRFGGNPSAIGKTVLLNGRAFTVIGVVGPEFRGNSSFFAPAAYFPITGAEGVLPDFEQTIAQRRRNGRFAFVGRLRPGMTLDEARVAVAGQAARLEQAFPEMHKDQRALVYPEPRVRLEPAAITYLPPVVSVFTTMVGLVLLVTCANVANLLLARATRRQREWALHVAMGAERARIIRSSLLESVILALLGGGLGLVFALWPTNVLANMSMATDLPIRFDFSIDYRVFVYTLLVAVGAGVISGVLPALHVVRTNLMSNLKEGGAASTERPGRHRLRDLLVVSQIAVSLVLLVCAGLFLRTTLNIATGDMGFDMQNRLIVDIDTDLRQYDEPRRRLFYRNLLDRVRTVPGVVSASFAGYLPIGFRSNSDEILVGGVAPDPEEGLPSAYVNVVSTDYFRTMGMPINLGRDFNENDNEESRHVAVINQAMAEKFWPGQDALGRRFSASGPEGPWLEVVGVTRVVKFVLPAERPTPGYYVPLEQHDRTDRVLHVHTQGDPMRLVPAVRAQVQALDPEMPIWNVRTMEDHIVRGKMVIFDIATGVMAVFGAIAVVLAGVGLYGVMAFTVSQRTREIGVRMALGESGGRVLGTVLRQGLVKAAIGVALGLLGALATVRLLSDYLVGVTPTDPLTFSVVVALLVAIALVASLVPARRAVRVDPLTALRTE